MMAAEQRARKRLWRTLIFVIVGGLLGRLFVWWAWGG
jgi:hypothetical protein